MRRADDALVGDALEVVGERRAVVDDLHAAAAEHVARAHQHRVADLLGDRDGAARSRCAVPLRGASRPASSRISENSPRSSARSMASGVVPRIGHARRLEALGEPERGLAAELHDDADELAATATPRG